MPPQDRAVLTHRLAHTRNLTLTHKGDGAATAATPP